MLLLVGTMEEGYSKAKDAIAEAFKKKYEKEINRGKKAVKDKVEKEAGKPTLEALGYTSAALKALTEKRVKLKKKLGNWTFEAEHSPYETRGSINYTIDF